MRVPSTSTTTSTLRQPTFKSSQKRTLLITGGSGCVGTHLVDLIWTRYANEFKEVRLIDLQPFPADLMHQLVERSPKLKLTTFEGSITDSELLGLAVRGCTDVIHLASLVGLWLPYERHHAINVKATQTLVELCKQHNVPRLVLMSSLDVVVGDEGMPTLEGTEDRPYTDNPMYFNYAKSKIEQEKIVIAANGATLANGGTLSTISLRPIGIYGERDIYHVGSVLAAGKNGTLKFWPKAEKAPWQHVYAGNVAYSAYLAMNKLEERPEVVAGKYYNVGDDTPAIDFLDFMEPFVVAGGCEMPRYMIPLWIMWTFAVIYEWLAWVLSPVARMPMTFTRIAIHSLVTPHVYTYKKLVRDLDYEPLFSYDESMQRTVAWIKTTKPKERYLDQ